MNPMEGDAFCLQGHSAVSWLALTGSGTIWVAEAGVQALQQM